MKATLTSSSCDSVILSLIQLSSEVECTSNKLLLMSIMYFTFSMSVSITAE